MRGVLKDCLLSEQDLMDESFLSHHCDFYFLQHRIQSNISAQVDNKVRALFDNFLQQNRNGTALAMMTQVYPESLQPESGLCFWRPTNFETFPKCISVDDWMFLFFIRSSGL